MEKDWEARFKDPPRSSWRWLPWLLFFLIPIPLHILPWYVWVGLIVVLLTGLGIADRNRQRM